MVCHYFGNWSVAHSNTRQQAHRLSIPLKLPFHLLPFQIISLATSIRQSHFCISMELLSFTPKYFYNAYPVSFFNPCGGNSYIATNPNGTCLINQVLTSCVTAKYIINNSGTLVDIYAYVSITKSVDCNTNMNICGQHLFQCSEVIQECLLCNMGVSAM